MSWGRPSLDRRIPCVPLLGTVHVEFIVVGGGVSGAEVDALFDHVFPEAPACWGAPEAAEGRKRQLALADRRYRAAQSTRGPTCRPTDA